MGRLLIARFDGIGRKPSGERLLNASPDGLRRSAFNSTPSGLGELGVFSQFRWLTHTGREVPPSGLNPNSRIFCKIHYRAGSLRKILYVRARRPTLLLLWAIRMPGRCGSWFASLMVPSPEGWYILCRRPRLQVQSKIREARRADTQDLLRHSWLCLRVMCQPSGLCA